MERQLGVWVQPLAQPPPSQSPGPTARTPSSKTLLWSGPQAQHYVCVQRVWAGTQPGISSRTSLGSKPSPTTWEKTPQWSSVKNSFLVCLFVFRNNVPFFTKLSYQKQPVRDLGRPETSLQPP